MKGVPDCVCLKCTFSYSDGKELICLDSKSTECPYLVLQKLEKVKEK